MSDGVELPTEQKGKKQRRCSCGAPLRAMALKCARCGETVAGKLYIGAILVAAGLLFLLLLRGLDLI